MFNRESYTFLLNNKQLCKIKGRCIFILNKTIGYYTRNSLKVLTIILLALVAILVVVNLKFDTVYKVTLGEKTIGYVEKKTRLEQELKQYIEQPEKQIAFIISENMPKCELILSSKKITCNEEEVLNTIENTQIVAYKNYAIILDGKEKQYVETYEQAKEIVEEIKKEYQRNLNLDLGIREVYSFNTNVEEVEAVEVSLALNNLEQDVNEKIRIMGSTVKGVTLNKPIKGTITSRYGVMSRIRSGAHTGLDIAAATGTSIRPAADGVVTWAGYRGNYGNLVIIEHKNGVETYYAHCSKIFAKVGDKVTTDTIISAVGSTGNSTGPHLHFEIRVDDQTLNPQKYLYKE